MLWLTWHSVCSHLGLFYPLHFSFPEFSSFFLFCLSCESNCYWIDCSTWRQQWHASCDKSIQAFSPLFVLQATKAGCGDLRTRLPLKGLGVTGSSSFQCSLQKLGVHYEIHNIQKPSEALPSLLVAESNQRVNGWQRHILFLDQTTKGILEAQRAQCPSLEAYPEHCPFTGLLQDM